MGKKKRRRRKPTAHPERMKQLAADILAGTVSGLRTPNINETQFFVNRRANDEISNFSCDICGGVRPAPAFVP